MIEINLLPEELRRKEPLWLSLTQLPIRKAAIMALSIFLGLQILAVGLIVTAHVAAAGMRSQAASLKQENRELLARKADLQELKKRMWQIQTLTHRNVSWTVLLDALTESITPGVWLRQLSLTDDKKSLKLEGSVLAKGGETAAIGRLIKSLKEHQRFGAFFTDIQLSSMTEKKIKESAVYDFILICIFRKGSA